MSTWSSVSSGYEHVTQLMQPWPTRYVLLSKDWVSGHWRRVFPPRESSSAMPRQGWKLFFDSWFFHEHMDTWLSIFSTFLDVDKRYNKKQIHEWMMGYGFYEKQGCDCVFTSIVHHGWWKVLDGGGSEGQIGVAKEECVHSSGPVGKKLRQFAQAWTKALRYLWQLGIPFPNDRDVKCLKKSSSKCSRFWK